MSQEKLFEALAQPNFFDGTDQARVIHTHISAVFVTNDIVYKIKKAKDYGFLDFTTLEKRKYFCEAEVKINRRWSEDIYLDVVAIVPDGDGFRLSDSDDTKAIEYMVKMVRISDSDLLSNILSSQKLTDRHIEQLAERLAEVYQSDVTTCTDAHWGSPDTILAPMQQNIEQVQPFVDKWIDFVWVHANGLFIDQCAKHFGNELIDRFAAGAIRQLHGDLHAEHVVFTDGEPEGPIHFIDGIEFNDEFRHIDHVSDLAFLLMDLDVRGARQFGAKLLTQVEQACPDPHRQTLLPLYLAYRAFVRGKVNSFLASSEEVPEFDRAEAMSMAKKYMIFATRYVLFGYEPTVVAVIGPTGSGKSTIAKTLCESLGCERFSSDRIRRTLADIPANAPTNSGVNDGAYSDSMTKRTYDTLVHGAVREASDRGLAIADATFLTEDRRSNLAKLATENGVRVIWVQLSVDEDTLQKRVAQREVGESEANETILKQHLEQWQPIAETQNDLLVLKSTETIVQMVEQLIALHIEHLA